ncbi:hypothetical protein [Nostoc sp. PA-18-2419]|uniref:hypothetical protein n=1 Tax=Nostoc sp. PA-18-2419 TaxID=2575443 RepID=UPI001108F15E|nr:hypothetical protein [Nostoc sp. PA-18-2419]
MFANSPGGLLAEKAKSFFIDAVQNSPANKFFRDQAPSIYEYLQDIAIAKLIYDECTVGVEINDRLLVWRNPACQPRQPPPLPLPSSQPVQEDFSPVSCSSGLPALSISHLQHFQNSEYNNSIVRQIDCEILEVEYPKEYHYISDNHQVVFQGAKVTVGVTIQTTGDVTENIKQTYTIFIQVQIPMIPETRIIMLLTTKAQKNIRFLDLLAY